MKLEWQENPSEELMSWSKAKKYANSLGGSWRLPSIQELKDAYHNKIEGFKPDVYWSSEEYVQNAWFIYFYSGYVNHYRKKTMSYVRCVRDELNRN